MTSKDDMKEKHAYSIKLLTPEDVTPRYVEWFNHPNVVQYSDNQYRQFSLEGQINYVNRMLESETDELYGIFLGTRHIGNVALSSINLAHKRAEVSYTIGETDHWGKGVATYAVTEAVAIARRMSLHKVYAGCAESNLASRRVLEKNGFSLEAILVEHLFYNGKWEDQFSYGMILSN